MAKLAMVWSRGGWAGVDLFFVLSGFLVSGLLFAEQRQSGNLKPIRFLVRRGFKIYPGFWALIAMTLGVRAVMHGKFDGKTVLSELCFVQNYGSMLWNHTWSLAVEEHFYFAIAAVLWFVLSARRRAASPFSMVPWLFAATAMFCLGWRFVAARQPGYDFYRNMARTHLRADSLMFGVLLAYCYHYKFHLLDSMVNGRRMLIGTAGVLLFIPPFVVERADSVLLRTMGLSSLYLGAGFLLLFVLWTPPPRRFVLNALARVGVCSYAIYLWHLPVKMWGAQILERFLGIPSGSISATVIYLVSAIVVGIIMTRLVEIPTLRLRDVLFPSADHRNAGRERQRLQSGEAEAVCA